MLYRHAVLKSHLDRLVRDDRGQDLIEYALMAAFMAVACAAFIPDVATSVSTIFSRITCGISLANAQGG